MKLYDEQMQVFRDLLSYAKSEGISQAEICRRAELDPGSISQCLRRNKIRHDTLEKVAEAVGKKISLTVIPLT